MRIGEELGITRERVRQLQNAAIGKLRHALVARDGGSQPAFRTAA